MDTKEFEEMFTIADQIEDGSYSHSYSYIKAPFLYQRKLSMTVIGGVMEKEILDYKMDPSSCPYTPSTISYNLLSSSEIQTHSIYFIDGLLYDEHDRELFLREIDEMPLALQLIDDREWVRKRAKEKREAL